METFFYNISLLNQWFNELNYVIKWVIVVAFGYLAARSVIWMYGKTAIRRLMTFMVTRYEWIFALVFISAVCVMILVPVAGLWILIALGIVTLGGPGALIGIGVACGFSSLAKRDLRPAFAGFAASLFMWSMISSMQWYEGNSLYDARTELDGLSHLWFRVSFVVQNLADVTDYTQTRYFEIPVGWLVLAMFAFLFAILPVSMFLYIWRTRVNGDEWTSGAHESQSNGGD